MDKRAVNIKKYCSLPGEGANNYPIVSQWLGTDSFENFIKQSREHQQHWQNQAPVVYNINKYGFRSDDFPEEECRDSITFIGCSNTVGVGIQKEKAWTTLLAKKLNLREINLGIGGGSTDSAFRVYNEWQPIHKSKITCFLLPPSPRLELIIKGSWRNIGHWSDRDNDMNPEILTCMLDETLNQVRVDRNLSAVKYIAQKTHSNLVVFEYHAKIKSDFGRDNMHAGPIWHEQIAEEFYNRIKKQE